MHIVAKLPDYRFRLEHREADYEKANTKLRRLRILVKEHPELEKQDAHGFTALDYAVSGETPTAAALLLRHGAVGNYKMFSRNLFKPNEQEGQLTNESVQNLYEVFPGATSALHQVVMR